MTLLDLFTWIDQWRLGEAIRGSSWVFAFIEVFHLMGITLLLGAVLVVNLRLLGFGLTGTPAAQVAEDAMPWMLVGLFVAMGSGFCLFVSEALKCYNNPPFFVKMMMLLLALVFTFTAHRRLTRGDQASSSRLWRTLGACLSLVLWFGVGLAGRAIAFY